VAAAAELRGDFVHVHLFAFGAEADASQFGLQFLEDASNHDRRDGADMVDESFRIAAVSASAGEVGFLQPEIGDLVLVRQMEVAVNMAQQARTRQRVRLINFVADFGEVSAAPDQFARDMVSTGTRARILKRAGVCGDCREEAIGNGPGDRPLRNLEQSEDKFPGGRLARRNPIDISIARVAFVVIDVDEELAVGNAGTDFPKPLEAGGVSGDDAIEFLAAFWLLERMVAVEEFIFLRVAIFVPAKNLFAFVAQGEAESKLRANAIAIRPDMAHDANGPALANAVEDAINDFRVRLHRQNPNDEIRIRKAASQASVFLIVIRVLLFRWAWFSRVLR